VDAALLHSFWTVLLLVIFVGIVVWVFVIKRSDHFDDAARMPLEPDEFSYRANEKKGRGDE
jgi:cytochrome c oxidase cbb3-type subunit 4